MLNLSSLRNPKKFRTCEPFKFSNARFFYPDSVANSATQKPWVFWDCFCRKQCSTKLLFRFIVGSMEAPSKALPLFFLLPDWLKLNHLKSRVECGLSDIFSRHICSTVAETIGVTNYAASFGAKKCPENHIWSRWDDARSVEPTIYYFWSLLLIFNSLPTFRTNFGKRNQILKQFDLLSSIVPKHGRT